MLQVKNSVVNTVANAFLTGVIAITSVTDCEAIETISPTFVNSDTSYSVSGDASAVGVGNITNLTPNYLDPSISDYRINKDWSDLNLTGVGFEGGNIAEWSWIYPLSSLGYTLLDTLEIPDLGGDTATNVTLKIRYAELSAAMIAGLKANGDDLAISFDTAGGDRMPVALLDGLNVFKTVVPLAEAGKLINIWGSNSTATQPLATEPFGSQAVYADKVFNLELANNSGNPVDTAGNSTGWSYTGGGTQTYSAAGVTLSNDRMLRNSNVVSLMNSDSSYHYKFRANITAISSEGKLFNTGQAAVMRQGNDSRGKILFDNGYRGDTPDGFYEGLIAGTEQSNFDLVFDGGSHRLYRNGVQFWVYSYGVAMDWQALTLFLFQDITLQISQVSLSNYSSSPSDVRIISANESDGWWIAADAPSAIPEATFSSDTVSASSFDGVARLPASFNSNSVSASEFFAFPRLVAGFASETTSESDFYASVSGTVSFDSVTASDSAFDGVVRLPAGFASDTGCAGAFDGVVRLLAGFDSAGVSTAVFDGVVRLQASFVSDTLVGSAFVATIQGQVNPYKVIRVNTSLGKARVVVKLDVSTTVQTDIRATRVISS